MLKLQTTYVNRQNTNEEVFKRANSRINSFAERHIREDRFRSRKEIIPISKYYEDQRRKLVVQIINAPQADPIRGATADANLRLIEYSTKRVGRPRNNWWTFALNQYWDHIIQQYHPELRGTALNLDSNQHIDILQSVS